MSALCQKRTLRSEIANCCATMTRYCSHARYARANLGWTCEADQTNNGKFDNETLYASGLDRDPSRATAHAENGIKCDEEMVDILKGAHYQEPYASLNPNRMVPMLEDGDLRLTESSVILKYLADKQDLPSYPKDLKKRAKINEVMDWLNTQ